MTHTETIINRRIVGIEREIRSAELRGDTVTADLFRRALAAAMKDLEAYWDRS